MQHCASIQPESAVMIVCSKPSQNLAEIFRAIAEETCTEAFLICSQGQIWRHSALGKSFRHILPNVDTTFFVHSEISPAVLPLKETAFRGGRFICIPANRPETFLRWARLKVNRIAEKTIKISEILSIGRELEIGSADKASLKMSIQRKRGLPDVGRLLENTSFCSLPAGEVRIQPVQSSIHGQIFVDKIAGTACPNNEGTTLFVKEGKISRIKGQGAVANMLRRRFRNADKEILEFSIGVNEHFSFGKNYYEDKRVLGAVSLSFKKTTNDRPSAPLSAISSSPNVFIDGRKIMNDGASILV